MSESSLPHPFCQYLPGEPDLHFHLMPVPKGRFWMGSESAEAYDDEKPVHEVAITRDFYIGQYPVTQALYKAVMGGLNPSYFSGDQRPVERISWYDAAVFCNVLNVRCGYAPAYYSNKACTSPFGLPGEGFELPNTGTVFLMPGHQGYRLPTEAEWEYAARGGELAAAQDFAYSGGQRLDELGWYDGNSHDETKAVGLKLPNALGLYDMSGNVWEWCGDWHGSDYYQQCLDKGLVSDPQGPEEDSYRVLRGGSWYNSARNCRLTYRFISWPGLRSYFVGFRLVLSFLPPVQ